MYKLENKFAIGCLVQWYEIEIIEEYIESLKQSLSQIDNRENVIVDFKLVINQELEKIDETKITIDEIITRFEKMIDGFELDITEELVTIADYRRWFNDYYCDKVDVLMWGETDALLPKQTFQILDNLHNSVKVDTPKYLSFFGTCKMWDETWKPIEHTDFTDKPFIDNDYDNWWSLKYTMNIEEMNQFNDKVENLDVRAVSPHKFNGCGLVISSEIIKAGVNIPRSVFFVHEDTSFMIMTNKLLGEIPQYVIKNVLLVHNRNHPKKRMYISGERDNGTMNEKRRSNEWYVKANKMSEQNCYNLFNTNYKSFTWEDVFGRTTS
tara:strand:- start:1384 stop:2352 length:969 start_codon:yes stop_codon:yes gene_type:complete